jgi:hypothetical protein
VRGSVCLGGVLGGWRGVLRPAAAGWRLLRVSSRTRRGALHWLRVDLGVPGRGQAGLAPGRPRRIAAYCGPAAALPLGKRACRGGRVWLGAAARCPAGQAAAAAPVSETRHPAGLLRLRGPTGVARAEKPPIQTANRRRLVNKTDSKFVLTLPRSLPRWASVDCGHSVRNMYRA